MNQRTLVALFATLLIIGGLYCFIEPSRKAGEPRDILFGIDGEKISSIKIEQGDNKIGLAEKNGQWVLPSRFDYPADSTKIRALLLKIFDLSASQKVPSTEGGIKKLGLDDEGVRSNQRTKIVLLDNSGSELGGIFLGENRKSERNDGVGPRMSITGQYVRSIDGKNVYLISTPVTVSTLVSEWIDTELLSLTGIRVQSVAQYRLARGASSQVYSLSLGSDGKIKFDGVLPTGEEIQEAVVKQVETALENTRIVDAERADSEMAKSLVFDEVTTYKLNNAAIYNIFTAKSGEKYYLKVEAALDETRFRELKSIYDKAMEEHKSKTEELKKAGKEAEISKLVEPKLEAATNESIEAQNERFRSWIFESASYQAQKFRKKPEDFFKKKEIPKS